MKLEVIVRLPEAEPRNPALLFIPGSWHGAWCWDEHFLPYFAEKGYAAYAMNLRGHGKSEGQLEGAGIKENIADIRQIVIEIGRPVVLVGHSMGGYLVLRYLEKYPAAGAVLMACVSPNMPPEAVKFLFGPFTRLAARFAYQKTAPGPRHAWQVKKMFFSASMPDKEVKRYTALLERDSLAFSFDFMNGKSFCLEEVRQTPLLVQSAAKDLLRMAICSRKEARQLNAEYQEFPDIAHDMMLESNWQQVADGLLSWLNRLTEKETLTDRVEI
jgi:pimeloyl-ACP methyl ester carboxylesterase